MSGMIHDPSNAFVISSLNRAMSASASRGANAPSRRTKQPHMRDS